MEKTIGLNGNAIMTTNLFDLSGKVAVITGGNSGIGLGMAEAIAAHGASVCIWGTNTDKNAVALETLQAINPGAHAIKCDVSDKQAVDKAFDQTLERFSRVDGCFANAGVGGSGQRFQETSVEEWRRIMDVNLDGLFYTFRRAAEHMVERAKAGDPGGRLIGISSLGAIMGMPRSQAYSGTKGAVISIMQGLAVEFARFGITANSILPGHIHTAMTDQLYQFEPFVSAYHSGDTLLIDGGFRFV